MSVPEEPKPETFELHIDWNGSAQTKTVQHANQVVIQIVEHELNLAFFQFNPPVVVGQKQEDIAKQLQRVEFITPDCIARINISARTAKGLIKALQKQFDEQGNLKGVDDADDE